MADTDLQHINEIAGNTGVDTMFVRAIIGLSRGVRTGLRMQLYAIKGTLQSKITQVGFKNRLYKRKQVISEQKLDSIATKLSQVKNTLNTLKIGPDFRNNEALKFLNDLLLAHISVKGIAIGGYKDLDSTMSTLRFNSRQLTKAANVTELTASLINKQIDKIDQTIKVIDAVDYL